ncbi:3-phosphoserine/phosphohydroxythreonine transaminase [Terrimonas sp. NA20]|uniref:Phosphoserine aminotransferase n=1 Tax=Terrimonas ginsenosidimutans TaxID=2908004 RepID=A0ABS9KNG4_9BACT|nr:3-phosphoserine/phosphohydroxythreonine transaminase [Terrimonas ginsenosidimutans]MCG2613855.1 3-phosphoserine/phosphohydroxythreonine transaminase [Terrimonas ginsenosidimutans]
MYNFNAGPSTLPKEVFEEASRAILNFSNTGLSILEVGHRTPAFESVMDEARSLVRELMNLDGDHEVLFLHGGASTQFMQVPMNLLNDKEVAAYTDTGVFASKALKEAKLFGHVEVVASSKDKNYTYLPKEFHVPATAKYLHVTSNNTIYGTQWKDMSMFEKFNVPVVADMSSDVLSRDMDFNKFDLIYAGAQKNVGAAGVNLVVINKNILGKVDRVLPTMMDYRQHVDNGSMLNTPPVFAVYVCMLTLKWLKENGGVPAIEKLNNAKATLFYDTLDSLPLFKGTVEKEDRSTMNAVFVMDNKELEKEFQDRCKQEGLYGVKGHRSVGGFRVSMYNALPLESVVVITEVMKDFANKKG